MRRFANRLYRCPNCRQWGETDIAHPHVRHAHSVSTGWAEPVFSLCCAGCGHAPIERWEELEAACLLGGMGAALELATRLGWGRYTP